MIVKLLPKQIIELWDSIRYGIINAVAPIIDPTPDNIFDILSRLLTQDMQCWCVFDEEKNIYGYVVTSISIDMNTKYRTLMVYSLFLYKKASTDMWDKSIKTIEDFARVNKCKRIIAYSNNPDVLSISAKYGFNQDYTYLIKDIGELNENTN